MKFALSISSTVFVMMMNAMNMNVVSAKTCVATALNRYLCTDNAERARELQWKDAPKEQFSLDDLDLGEEQAVGGTAEEQEKVNKILADMRKYFENEVLVEDKYASVMFEW